MSKYLKLFENDAQYLEYKNSGDMILPNVSHCVQENEVHYNPFDPYNGHAYVDLGLPSGTKWATMNVGANSETDYGLYFAWGETEGHANASTKKFSYEAGQNDYKFTEPNGINWDDTPDFGISKYNNSDGLTELDPADDAATAAMGGLWHMPSRSQYQELLNTTYVTNQWVTNYNGSGVNGRLFTSVSNGNTLFIPAAGSCGDGDIWDVGSGGYYWPRSLDTDSVNAAWYLYFNDGRVGIGGSNYRCGGLSVRGVVG